MDKNRKASIDTGYDFGKIGKAIYELVGGSSPVGKRSAKAYIESPALCVAVSLYFLATKHLEISEAALYLRELLAKARAYLIGTYISNIFAVISAP